MAEFPFPLTDLPYVLCDGNAERGVTVEPGNTDLDFGHLPVEAPCPARPGSGLLARHEKEALPQPFHACILSRGNRSRDQFLIRLESRRGFGGDIRQPSPHRVAQKPGRAHRLVSGEGACACWLSGLGVLAGRDDGMRATRGDCVMAFAGVAGAVGGDPADLLVGRNLVETFGQ